VEKEKKIPVSWQFSGSINQISLIALAATSAVGMLLAAMSSYKEYQYFWIVSQLQDQFEIHLQKLKTEKLNTVSVPAEEVQLLGKLETAQLNQKIKTTASRLANTLSDFYSITITPEVLKFLNSLSGDKQKDKYVIRDFIDSLQTNPYSQSVELSGNMHELVGRIQNYEIVYRVNAKQRNVEVIAIR
jgi:mRNA-degrading endonuclease RelE of RelBE toxin-antitoxin system